MRPFIQRYPFFTFTALVLALQWAIVLFVKSRILPGEQPDSDELAHMVFRMRVFGPIVMVLLVSFYLEGTSGIRKLFSSFLHWRIPFKWYALALGWKFTMAAITLLIILVLYGIKPVWLSSDILDPLVTHIPFIVGIGLVEEITWVGFAVPRMQKRFNAFWTAVIVGNCWALWYLPMNLIDIGTPRGVSDLGFHVCLITLMVLCVFAYNTTRSGVVLLLMQMMGNTAFFIVPMLPNNLHDSLRIDVYAFVFVALAIAIIAIYGPKNLSRRQKYTWDDIADEERIPEQGRSVTERLLQRT